MWSDEPVGTRAELKKIYIYIFEICEFIDLLEYSTSLSLAILATFCRHA